MITTLLAATAALALGYGLGRLRPGRTVSAWAADNNATSRWEQRRYRWPSHVVMALELVWRLTAHPIASRRNRASWREADHREPAPALDPNWAAHRAGGTA